MATILFLTAVTQAILSVYKSEVGFLRFVAL